MRFLSQVAIVASVLTVVSAAIFITTKGDNGSRAAEAKLGEPDSRENGVFRPTPTQWASLTVQPVEMQTFRSEFPTEGKIAIDEDRATRIYSPYAGRIMKLLVAPGDRIQQGQLIFAIHANDSVETQKDFMAALTGLNKARSQLNLAKITEQRLGNLARDKAMPLKDWQEAQANLTAAQNDLRSAEIALQAVRNRLRLLGKTDEEIDTFEKTGIISPEAPVYSPISGTILQRNVGPGQYVDAGGGNADPIFRIGDVSKVWLVAYVRETDAAKVRIGQTIKFTVLAHAGHVFECKVNYIGWTLDAGSRRLTVRASVDNSERLLTPEMFTNVNIVVDEGQPAPAVPRDAVVYEGGAARVWVVRDGNGVELRRVKTGLTNGEMVQVLDGLNPGDKVVTKGSLFIDRAATLGS